jgi:hypothetical protein
METASAVLPMNGHQRARRQWASRAYTPHAASPATRLVSSTSTASTRLPAELAPSLSVSSTPASRMTTQTTSAAATAAATTARLPQVVGFIVFLPRWRLVTTLPQAAG